MTPQRGPLDELERTTITGDVEIDLRNAVDRWPLVERECRTRCASGDPFEGRWQGLPLAELLTDVDPGTTHLVAEAADGFRACIDIVDAVDGIIAVERLDRNPATGGFPRLVVPGLLGTRLVKDLARLETRRLPPTLDSEELERLDPAEPGE